MAEDFDFSQMSEEEKAAYYEMMEAYFDSDEFLEEPWMQDIKAEIEKGKTVALNFDRVKDIQQTEKLLKEIMGKEGIDGTIEYDTDLAMGDVGLYIIADEFECSGSKMKQTKEKFKSVIELSDNFLIMPRTDGKLNIDFTFHHVTVELK